MTKLNEVLVVDCGSDLHVYVGTFPYTHTVFAKTIDFKRIYTEETLPDEIKLAIGMINATNGMNSPYGHCISLIADFQSAHLKIENEHVPYDMTADLKHDFSKQIRYAVNISSELYSQLLG